MPAQFVAETRAWSCLWSNPGSCSPPALSSLPCPTAPSRAVLLPLALIHRPCCGLGRELGSLPAGSVCSGPPHMNHIPAGTGAPACGADPTPARELRARGAGAERHYRPSPVCTWMDRGSRQQVRAAGSRCRQQDQAGTGIGKSRQQEQTACLGRTDGRWRCCTGRSRQPALPALPVLPSPAPPERCRPRRGSPQSPGGSRCPLLSHAPLPRVPAPVHALPPWMPEIQSPSGWVPQGQGPRLPPLRLPFTADQWMTPPRL